MLAGERTEAIHGYEVSDKLVSVAEEYKSDNLPITFRNKIPGGTINPDHDDRLFVSQLHSIGVSAARIRSAIIDYYRAFEQRSSWARENLLVSGEVEEYEDRLVDEWSRYKDVILETLDGGASEEALVEAGKQVYRWAEFETTGLRIRERVTEPYVVRGTFHILANGRPAPRVYWHPLFINRLAALMEVPA